MGVFEAAEQSRMIFEEKRKYVNFNENYKATDPRRQGQLAIYHVNTRNCPMIFSKVSFFLSRAFLQKHAHSRTAEKWLVACSLSTGQAEERLPDFSSDSVCGAQVRTAVVASSPQVSLPPQLERAFMREPTTKSSLTKCTAENRTHASPGRLPLLHGREQARIPTAAVNIDPTVLPRLSKTFPKRWQPTPYGNTPAIERRPP